MPSGMSVDTNDTYALMNPYYAWYGQDTWRVNRNLTLTFGLRMEYEQGPTERYNRALSYFDPESRAADLSGRPSRLCAQSAARAARQPVRRTRRLRVRGTQRRPIASCGATS